MFQAIFGKEGENIMIEIDGNALAKMADAYNSLLPEDDKEFYRRVDYFNNQMRLSALRGLYEYHFDLQLPNISHGRPKDCIAKYVDYYKSRNITMSYTTESYNPFYPPAAFNYMVTLRWGDKQ